MAVDRTALVYEPYRPLVGCANRCSYLDYVFIADSSNSDCLQSSVHNVYALSFCFVYELRGGFRHVQHVRPNRGPHKKGAPTRGNVG